MEEEYIKLIFGLKLKQIRTAKKLSLYGLSKLSGLSKSYLNEIENGKKYPKSDKIAILSEKLEVPYEQMVSLKLDKNLAPIGEILQSKILKEIPLELFGIKESNLIDIVANAPAKVNAFISTIIEIAQHYDLSKESFFLASVRSFQEANNNYFEDLEQKVLEFSRAYQIDSTTSPTSRDLEEILIEEYGYTINEKELAQYEALENLRSVFVPETKTLLLSSGIDEAQRSFIYAKEIAYNFMKITDRLNTFPWIKFERFDQVLNNFYASYFAGALIIPEKALTAQLKTLFGKETFDSKLFNQMLNSFNASPESYYQRMTNILPKAFNIQDFFFLRIVYKTNTQKFLLDKELHLTHQQQPKVYESDGHYCRRWASIRVLQTIDKNKSAYAFDMQISNYPHQEPRYLILSSATPDPFKDGQYRSVNMGLMINKQLERKINFLKDPNLIETNVGVTCENCPVLDCEVRQVAPVILEKLENNEKIERIVEELNVKFQVTPTKQI